MNYKDHQRAMLGDLFLEMIGDPDLEASQISDAVIEELRDIYNYHAGLAEKTAKLISYLGG